MRTPTNTAELGKVRRNRISDSQPLHLTLLKYHTQKLPYLTGNSEQSGCRENVLDITHALMDAGFNDTVTFVISFIWEMLEIGAK